MKHFSRLVRVLVLVGVTMTFTAAPVHAGPYQYPGIQCGPDQVAYIWTVSSGPGSISGDYLTWRLDGSMAFGGFSYATGSHTTYMPSRNLGGYNVSAHDGATLQAHGVGCAA